MPDDVTDIIDHYSSDPEREQYRLDRHQLEYDLTWRYLDRYLPDAGPVLEVGAATGRYTLELARRGYRVTAVDFSPALLEVCERMVAAEGLADQVTTLVADGRDLGELPRRHFAAALLMGPLYHLVEEADRIRVLRETFERLLLGGVLFSAFIGRFGIMGDLLKNLPGWIEERDKVAAHMETGARPPGSATGGFRGYFATVAEIAPLHEAVGFETLAVAGVEPAISADDESYNKLEGERRRLWLDLLFELSRKRSVLGASRHLLYVGRKARPGS